MAFKHLDRFGNERNLGYRKENFAVCLKCNPTGKPKNTPDPKCTTCGGYGEYPKSKT